MRRSIEDHPLVVLRHRLKLTQKEMGEACGISTATVRQIERHPSTLIPKLRRKISAATWVDESWLQSGDPKAPIKGLISGPYHNGYFRMAQCLGAPGKDSVANAMKVLGPILKDLLTDASRVGELKAMFDHLRELLSRVRIEGRHLGRKKPK